jgi:hypothetical protein
MWLLTVVGLSIAGMFLVMGGLTLADWLQKREKPRAAAALRNLSGPAGMLVVLITLGALQGKSVGYIAIGVSIVAGAVALAFATTAVKVRRKRRAQLLPNGRRQSPRP